MIARFTAPLAAALAGLAAPLAAQQLPVEPLPPPPDTVTAAPEPAAEGVWHGEWRGEWRPDGTYHGTWTGSYDDAEAASDADRRAAWIERCRDAYREAAPRDWCESYLAHYEHAYAAAVQGAVLAGPPHWRAPPHGAPGAYLPLPYAAGYPYGPVVWVRVPIVREPAAPGK